MTTINDFDIVKEIKESLLKSNLSPCIQSFSPIESNYIWKNKIISDNEILLLIKSISSNKDKIFRLIKNLHTYDTPEIICFNFDILNSDYKNWFDNVSK